MRNIYLTSALALLTACNPASEDPVQTDDISLSNVDIRVTEAIETPHPMIDATFIPNRAPMSAWLGSLVLLDNERNIWRTNTNGAPLTKLADGPFDNISGYADDTHSYIFTLKDGKLGALQSKDSGETVEPVSVFTATKDIISICDGGTQSKVWVLTKDKKLFPLLVKRDRNELTLLPAKPVIAPRKSANCALDSNDNIVVQASSLATQTYIDGKWIDNPHPAYLSPHVSLSQDKPLFVGIPKATNEVAMFSDDDGRSVTFTGGITVDGIDSVSFIDGTRLPMGSVYDKGLLIVGDSNTNRLLLVALPYAEKTYSESLR